MSDAAINFWFPWKPRSLFKLFTSMDKPGVQPSPPSSCVAPWHDMSKELASVPSEPLPSPLTQRRPMKEQRCLLSRHTVE